MWGWVNPATGKYVSRFIGFRFDTLFLSLFMFGMGVLYAAFYVVAVPGYLVWRLFTHRRYTVRRTRVHLRGVQPPLDGGRAEVAAGPAGEQSDHRPRPSPNGDHRGSSLQSHDDRRPMPTAQRSPRPTPATGGSSRRRRRTDPPGLVGAGARRELPQLGPGPPRRVPGPGAGNARRSAVAGRRGARYRRESDPVTGDGPGVMPLERLLAVLGEGQGRIAAALAALPDEALGEEQPVGERRLTLEERAPLRLLPRDLPRGPDRVAARPGRQDRQGHLMATRSPPRPSTTTWPASTRLWLRGCAALHRAVRASGRLFNVVVK